MAHSMDGVSSTTPESMTGTTQVVLMSGMERGRNPTTYAQSAARGPPPRPTLDACAGNILAPWRQTLGRLRAIFIRPPSPHEAPESRVSAIELSARRGIARKNQRNMRQSSYWAGLPFSKSIGNMNTRSQVHRPVGPAPSFQPWQTA